MPKGKPTGTIRGIAKEVRERAAQQGITPLEVMLKSMRRAVKKLKQEANTLSPEELDLWERKALEAAQMAAPYIHPKLQAVESKVEAKVEQTVVSAVPLTDAEWEQTYSKPAEPAVEPVEQPQGLH